jgi:hypothetical protein
MGYWDKVQEILAEYQKKIEGSERKTFNLLAKRYGSLSSFFTDYIEKLSAIENKTPNQIRKLSVYQDFLKDSNNELTKYAVYSDELIKKQQEIYLKYGLDQIADIFSTFDVKFEKLNLGAINYIIGQTSEGERLYNILLGYNSETVEKMTKTLLESVAIGRNPRVTARLLTKDSNIPLWKSLRLSRTETMQAYRLANKESMKNSGLVKKVKRIEQSDACDYCQSVNGNVYPIDSNYGEWHPNCRGTTIPIIEF